MKFSAIVLTTLLGLASARRRLEDEEQQEDFSWMSGYTMKYEQCFNDNGQDLVYFSLCPAESKCVAGCEGGTEYVASLNYFVDAFTEAQMGAREYACEMVREACEENGEDEDQCYANAGMDYCEDDEEGNFNLQEYLECKEFDGEAQENDDEDEEEQQGWVAPVCRDGLVYLGYFADEDCTQQNADETFINTYGYELDYSQAAGVPIIADDCANCKEHGAEQDQNDGDQEDEDDVLEQCEELYTYAQDYEAVAEKYDGVISDVRKKGMSKKNKALLIAAVLVVGLLSLACCWYSVGKGKNDKKTALLQKK